MIPRYLSGVALAALLSSPAFATSPTFSYLDLAYVRGEHGEDGGGVRASAAIGDLMLVQLDAAERERFEGSAWHLSLGPAAHWEIADGFEVAFGLSADLVGGAFEEPGSFGDGGWDGMEVGGGANVELRARLSPRIELNAGARFESVTDEFIPSAGARFYFSPRVAAGVRVVHDYFDTRVDLALHINFGD